jgi:hypothetical protein
LPPLTERDRAIVVLSRDIEALIVKHWDIFGSMRKADVVATIYAMLDYMQAGGHSPPKAER